MMIVVVCSVVLASFVTYFASVKMKRDSVHTSGETPPTAPYSVPFLGHIAIFAAGDEKLASSLKSVFPAEPSTVR
jgi:hypothetical protein